MSGLLRPMRCFLLWPFRRKGVERALLVPSLGEGRRAVLRFVPAVKRHFSYVERDSEAPSATIE